MLSHCLLIALRPDTGASNQEARTVANGSGNLAANQTVVIGKQ